MPAQITVTKSLVDRLSGKQPPSNQQSLNHSTLGSRSVMDPELAKRLSADQGTQQALRASAYVGKLLLKNETTELSKVNEMADELLKSEYRPPVKAMACEDARRACLECYQAHTQDALKCSAVVDAYSKCASRLVSDRVR